jgi:hypothetical protein
VAAGWSICSWGKADLHGHEENGGMHLSDGDARPLRAGRGCRTVEGLGHDGKGFLSFLPLPAVRRGWDPRLRGRWTRRKGAGASDKSLTASDGRG